MYENDLQISAKRANANRVFVEAAIESYEERNKSIENPDYRTKFQEDAVTAISAVARKQSVGNRYRSFVESVKSSLVIECMYNILENAIDPSKRDLTNTSILRAMVSQYVTENGYENILNTMKTASTTMSKLHNIITEAADDIIDGVDKEDPNTFTITPDKKDEFFKSLNYSDSQEISDAITDRVSTAMDDFVTANTKDHEDIESALQDAQEKINKNADAEEAVKESYEIQAKRKISVIRNAPKNVLHGMISAMCETVLKKPNEYAEFMTEGKLDVPKVVDRVTLMYTFMEMLNTSRLEKIDESFINGVLSDLRN